MPTNPRRGTKEYKRRTGVIQKSGDQAIKQQRGQRFEQLEAADFANSRTRERLGVMDDVVRQLRGK